MDLVQGDMSFRIRGAISAIENFVHLNERSGYPRKIVPITSSKQPFLAFSEKATCPTLLETWTDKDETFGDGKLAFPVQAC